MVKKILYIFRYILPGILIISSVTHSQSTSTPSYNIKGKVKDFITGEALMYAAVQIKGTNIGAATNEGGYFVIIGAPHDSLVLVVSYIGYLIKEIPFDNSKGNSEQLLIELNPKPIESKEVVVEGENYKIWKSDNEVGQITISPKEISNLPRIGEADIFRSLQLLPGISGINGGAELSILGGTPDQNLVLLDGMTVYHVNHFFGFFSAFNSDAIKDVRVYKGGYPAKFGGRLSSVIDLNGKTGNVNKFNLDVGLSLLSINGLVQIPLFNKGSVLISARRSFNGPLYQSIFSFLSGGESENQAPAGAFRPGNFQQEEVLPLSYFYDLNTKVSYQLSKKDFASLSFYSGDDYLDQSEQGGAVRIGGGPMNSGGKTKWGNIGTSLKWMRQWNDLLFSNMIVSFSRYNSDNTNSENFRGAGRINSGNSNNDAPSERTETNQINDFTISLDNEWSAGGYNKINLGAVISSINTEYRFDVDDSSIVSMNNKSQSTAFYIQDNIEVMSNLNFNLGIRGTYFNLTQTTYWEPRASFNYSFFGNFKLKGAWGKYHQFINQITHENILQGSRDFWIVADKNLNPGFSEHNILSIEYETNDYLFSIEGYYKKFENLIEFSQRIPGNPQNINYYNANFFMGNGYSKGIQFLLQKKFGAFNTWASYTLGKVENTFSSFDNNDPFPADQDRTHEIKVAGDLTIGNWNLSASWIYSTGKPYTSPESKYFITLLNGQTESYIHVSDKNAYRLPDYQSLDISAAYNFTMESYQGQIGASVHNLYAHKNVWYRRFDLSSNPVKVIDVTMLGFTPTIFIKLSF